MKTVTDFMLLSRVELAGLCKKHKPKPKYEIVELAAQYKLKTLYLPAGHPELNSIEMIWTTINDFIKKTNVNRLLKEVKELTNEIFNTFDNSKWMNCFEHVKKVENEYLEVAGFTPVAI